MVFNNAGTITLALKQKDNNDYLWSVLQVPKITSTSVNTAFYVLAKNSLKLS